MLTRHVKERRRPMTTGGSPPAADVAGRYVVHDDTRPSSKSALVCGDAAGLPWHERETALRPSMY